MKSDEFYRITPERAAKILSEAGMKVTVEQAKLILDFLFKLANISLDTYAAKKK